MEDCLAVVEMCSAEIQLLDDFVLLQGIELDINVTELGLFDCSRTDDILNPLPHCCSPGGYVYIYIRMLYLYIVCAKKCLSELHAHPSLNNIMVIDSFMLQQLL